MDPVPAKEGENGRLARAADICGKLLVIAAAVLAGLLLFWTLRSILIPILLALLISTQLSPVVRWLRSKHVPEQLAVALTVLLAVLLFAGAVTLIVGQVVSESDELSQNLSAGADDAAAWLAANSGPLELSESEVRAEAEKLSSRVTESPGTAVGGVVDGLSAVRLHPMITLAAVTTGGLVAGVIGAFIAVPLMAVIWALGDEWHSEPGIRPTGE